MQVSAGIRQSWGLKHYGEFDSFEDAGVTWRWKYVRGAEILVLLKFWC